MERRPREEFELASSEEQVEEADSPNGLNSAGNENSGLKDPLKNSLDSLVPKKGLEPPHPCEYVDLNHARLPIPPLRHGTCSVLSTEQAAILSLANAATGVKFQSTCEMAGLLRPGLSKSATYTIFASSVISVLLAKSREIGQPALASPAALSKASFVTPGTLAVVVRTMRLTVGLPSIMASVTAA